MIKHKDLLKELRNMEFNNIIELYIEAKTGGISRIEDLPVDTLNKIAEIEEDINYLIAQTE